MKNSRRTRRTILLLIVSTLLSAYPVLGQVKKRVIPFPEWASSSAEDNEVLLEVVEIKVAGKPIVLGRTFDADENWLKDMVMRVKNVSNKAIITFGLSGGFLEGIDEELQPYASYQYALGWDWGR